MKCGKCLYVCVCIENFEFAFHYSFLRTYLMKNQFSRLNLLLERNFLTKKFARNCFWICKTVWSSLKSKFNWVTTGSKTWNILSKNLLNHNAENRIKNSNQWLDQIYRIIDWSFINLLRSLIGYFMRESFKFHKIDEKNSININFRKQ